MESIGYGIIIAALIGIAQFGGLWLGIKAKGTSVFQPFNFLNDKREEEEIMQAAKVKPANYDEPPKTAEEYQAKYSRDGFHEELPHAKGH